MHYQFVIFILLMVAGYLICRQILKIPQLSMRKSIKNLEREKESAGTRLLNLFVMPLVKPIARLIRIAPEKEVKMAAMLKRGGLTLTPKEYYARALLCAAFTLPFSLLLFIIGASSLAPIILLLSVIIYFHFTTDLKDQLKAKKALIEMELPGFVRSILYKLEDIQSDNDRTVVQVDLVQVFEDYLVIASDAFRYDVAMLVMEMKSRSIEAALRSFNERIGIPEISYLVNALISLYRGEHQGEALRYLAKDMDLKAKEGLRKRLGKLPGKIKIASIPLVIVTLATLLYVIGSHLVQSMGGLF